MHPGQHLLSIPGEIQKRSNPAQEFLILVQTVGSCCLRESSQPRSTRCPAGRTEQTAVPNFRHPCKTNRFSTLLNNSHLHHLNTSSELIGDYFYTICLTASADIAFRVFSPSCSSLGPPLSDPWIQLWLGRTRAVQWQPGGPWAVRGGSGPASLLLRSWTFSARQFCQQLSDQR